MKIICDQLNPHACKTYLIAIEGGREAVLIDPVLDHVDDFIKVLEERGLSLAKAIDTHTHADHISGAAALKDRTGCAYAMHKNGPARCVDFSLDDGYEWDLLGEIPVKVLYSPGHTADSISLIFPDRIFTGDALFLEDGGAGRDDLPGGDAGAHWETLEKMRQLPEDLIVYPAHDYRDRQPSSLKHQKATNPHMKERTKQEFIHFLDELKLGPAEWMKDVLKANYACARDPRAAWIPVDSSACEVKGTLAPGINDIKVGSVPVGVLRNKLASENPPVLIDVREEDELDGPLGHIEGILHIPVGGLTARLDELADKKDAEIITVCRSGGRARTAAQIMTKAGFANVVVLAGGMTAWRQIS